MGLKFFSEFEVDKKTSIEISALLKRCFPAADYHRGPYFKQLPHYRLLAYENGKLIGQLGMDLRMMNMNGEAVCVLGVVDLCVHPEFRGAGVGKSLMAQYEAIASQHADRIDFLFLVTDLPGYYEKLGFTIADIKTVWLKIHRHKNHGIADEKISDAKFMVKSVSGKEWVDGDLELLGYMY